ncbi:uncharacterized protein LOC143371127 isoform X2 [Andrena cerasifolii]|uniref:uncharacterized protein LOC143371127 isoform X2 n=1 Tax=Andrena cerasifolii TaxID=2819439 RepID=UPI004037686B
MQLAATQRPHPPPVPPRPSRQVVAEALKRSPRPPCPTRQAPPPPNTKPWRSDQEQSSQQQVCPAVAGRTVVYESIKEPLSKETANENTTGAVDHAARLVEKDRRAARNGSERNDDEDDRRGNPRERRHRAANQEQRENSIEPTGILERRCSMPQARENPAESRESGKTEASANSSESNVQNNDSGRRRSCDDPRDEDHARGPKEIANEASTETRNEMPIPCAKARVNAVARSVALAPKIDRSRSQPEHGAGSKAATKTDARPTPTQRLALARSGRDAAKKSATGTCSPPAEGSSLNENAKPGSIVDRPAAVVIDEPERKATSNDDDDNNDENDNIHRQDWLEAGVHYSSTQITLSGDDGDAVDGDPANGLDRCENEKVGDLNFLSLQERIAMSSLQGLPPLPRSLSGFNLSGGRSEGCEPPPPPTRSSSKSQRGGKSSIQSSSRPSPPARQLTTLDTQLAILRREMFGLRQLDLSLLSQLWSLNESIQEFRQLLQEQEDRAPSPSPSSEEGDDTSYGTHPPPPPRRPAPVIHHHRPPRPPRPSRPPPSDESPSSEEYGAV